MTGEERDAIYEACLGNPLILTYLVSLFERTVDTSVSKAIELAGNYAGRIDQYTRNVCLYPFKTPT